MKKRKSSQIHEGSKRILKFRGKETLETGRWAKLFLSLWHSVIGEGFLGGTFKTWDR